jgi:hypothetical protein
VQKRSFYFDLHIGVFIKKRQIHTNFQADIAIKLILVVLSEMKVRIIKPMNDSNSIYAYKDWSIISNGELLTISIRQSESDHGCDIDIQSESTFPIIYDLGVNNRNLDKFVKLFRETEHKQEISEKLFASKVSR